MEILVVLAIMGMVSGLVVASFGNLIQAIEEEPIERVFRQTVREARILAATSKNTVYLSYNKEYSEFRLVERSQVSLEEEGGEDEDFDQPLFVEQTGEPGLSIEFFPKVATRPNGFSSGGEFAQEPAKYLSFHPSGVATAAKVVFTDAGFTDSLTVDAFSSGPIPVDDE